jgi:hypothetical protein
MEKTCAFCDEPILETEEEIIGLNFRAHVECEFRQVAGSVGHQMKRCSCFGGIEEDPPGMTRREAARAAYSLSLKNDQEPQNRPPSTKPLYYDRQGNPIVSTLVWARMFEDSNQRSVRETHLPNGFLISTVWLGLNHNPFSDRSPLIFESMVFRDCRDFGGEDWDQVRYSTEAEAVRGHEVLVHRWSMKRRRRPKVYSQRRNDK